MTGQRTAPTTVRKTHRMVVAIAVAAMTLAACGSSGSTSAPTSGSQTASSSGSASASSSGSASASSSGSQTASSSSAPVSVSIGVAAPTAEMAVAHYAQSKGFLTKNGINAKVTPIPAAQLLAALAAGRLQFGVYCGPQPEGAILQGAPLKWVAVWDQKPDLQFIVGPGIKTGSDLKGKPIAVTAAGSTTAILADAVLSKFGLTKSDYQPQMLGSVTETHAAFLSGKVDAEIAGPPATSALVAKRPGSKVLVDLSTSYDWPCSGLVAYMPWATSHRADTEHVIKGFIEAVKSFQSDTKGAEQAISEVANITTPADIQTSYEAARKLVSPNLVPSLSLEQAELKVLSQFEPKANPSQAAQMIDTSFATAAEKAAS